MPIFESLGEAELERLARRSADIRLQPGEYVAHEGEGRALFVVLEGEASVTKSIDGIERVIGRRMPGEVFGEVPIVLGTAFLANLRAATPARIMRIEPRDFHAAAASAPELAAAVGALARERIEGLHDIAADAPQPRATIVGERYDSQCRALREFLDRNGVSFDWITPDDPCVEKRIPGHASIKGRFPVVALEGGGLLVRPEQRELARRLGLTTTPSFSEYDTVIIGGGPAGLAASVYGASEGLRTLMIEREAPGGQAGTSSRIENYLGFPNGVTGGELASRALAQAKRFGAEILVTRSVSDIDTDRREIELDGGEVVRARTIVLATGVSWRRIPIKGFDELTGRGIYYGASQSEASTLAGLDVFLIGAGNSAGQAAMYFSNYARSVTLIVRGSSLEKSMSYYLVEQLATRANVHVRLQSEVAAVYGVDHLEAVDITGPDGTTEKLPAAALYVFIGADAQTSWLPAAIERDDRGFVSTGEDAVKNRNWTLERDPYLLETSVPGIFACGDVRNKSIKRVAAAVGEGSMTIALVHQFLQAESTVNS
ncbi:MAG TPA: FAD-dependent oxidoreductase [Candidatus Baltobacteraceae bacterium]|nr:FAD-dependent oxidoreductase [Candidatus Baltobacteraceae bacterium]